MWLKPSMNKCVCVCTLQAPIQHLHLITTHFKTSLNVCLCVCVCVCVCVCLWMCVYMCVCVCACVCVGVCFCGNTDNRSYSRKHTGQHSPSPCNHTYIQV